MEFDNSMQLPRVVDPLPERIDATPAKGSAINTERFLRMGQETISCVLADYGDSYVINRIATIDAWRAAATPPPEAVSTVLDALDKEELALRELLIMVGEQQKLAAHEIDEHRSAPGTLTEVQVDDAYKLYVRLVIIDDLLASINRYREQWTDHVSPYVPPIRIYFADTSYVEDGKVLGWWSSTQEFAGHTYREALEAVAKWAHEDIDADQHSASPAKGAFGASRRFAGFLRHGARQR